MLNHLAARYRVHALCGFIVAHAALLGQAGCSGTNDGASNSSTSLAPAGPAVASAGTGGLQPVANADQATSTNPAATTAQVSGAAPSLPTGTAVPTQSAPATEPSAAAGAANNPPATANGFVPYPDLRGGCTLSTNFPDDRACIPPPAPGEGVQIHIGPKNYDDPEEVAKFIMHPGEESSECWIYRTPNEQDVFFQSYVLSGRAGTHHILGSMLEGDVPTDQGFGRCADTRDGSGVINLGPMPMATKPYMPRTQVAPENTAIAHRLPARVLAQADMHYYNFTDQDILREIWINLYTAPPETITGEMVRVRGMGGFGWSQMPIEPGTDQVYQYECPVVGDGRILELLGHYHAHGRRFTASIKRKAGGIEKVFEMYDYQDPAGFEYNSVTQNPPFSEAAAGAVSGILEVHDGDVLAWECHIVNDSDVPLGYTNEVKTGEMCNLWGHSHGINQWDCLLR